MTTKTKICNTGEIISIGLGRLCCPIERLYEIYNFLTGDTLFTHQLPRAYRACESWIKLSELDSNACNRDNWKQWLAAAEAKYGNEHELKPLPSGQWKSMDPVTEAIVEDKNKVIVVQP